MLREKRPLVLSAFPTFIPSLSWQNDHFQCKLVLKNVFSDLMGLVARWLDEVKQVGHSDQCEKLVVAQAILQLRKVTCVKRPGFSTFPMFVPSMSW